MKSHQEQGPPCSHMEGLLNQAADGSSRGIRLWYAISHAARCHRCGLYLQRLREMLNQVKSSRAKEPSADVLSRLESMIPKD